MSDSDFAQLRRSPFGGDDLNAVFGQLDQISSVPMSAAEDLGVTPENVSFIRDGLLNGDFRTPPPDTASDINDVTNKLPGWSFVQSSGTGVTGIWVTDSSGGKLRLKLAAGAAGDEGYFEQIAPVGQSSTTLDSSARQIGVWPTANIIDDTTLSNAAVFFLATQFLKADGTTTGASDEQTDLCSNLVTDDQHVLLSTPNATGTTPSDAAFVRVRIGLRRGAAATSATNQCSVDFAYMTPLNPRIRFADLLDNSNVAADIALVNGTFQLTSNEGDIKLNVVSPNGVHLTGRLIHSGIVYADVTANKNNYAPTGWQGCTMLFLDPDAARNITGFEAPTDSREGVTKIIHNVDSTYDITLVHGSGSSDANNRIYGSNGSDIVIRPYGSVWLVWAGKSDGTELRWRNIRI